MKYKSIAIDGPAGAGKSTVAKEIAKRCNILYLDTGAMYRAVAYYAIQKGVDPREEARVEEILPDVNIEVKLQHSGEQRVLVNGQDVTPFLREAQISKGASDIAVHPAVRKKLVQVQRAIADGSDVVMDGRDIGTYVLPNATHKIFLTATSRERARRRLKEMQDKGQALDMTLDQMEQDIIARDKTDSSRAFAPLKQAEDAILVDSTHMTAEEVVNWIMDTISSGV